MNARRFLKYTVAGLGAACLLVVAFLIRFPRDPLYLCQKILYNGLEQWKLEAGTNVWPNVDGNSARSFAEIEELLGPPGNHDYSQAYGYVPGLKDDDPRDLIFMYMKQKTRRTWNGDHSASVFSGKKWMVFGPDFWTVSEISESLPEGGELVDTTEFTRRLQKTFQFLRDNDRPHCEAVIAEHSRFLESLVDGKE
jgi:hypothetical protein